MKKKHISFIYVADEHWSKIFSQKNRLAKNTFLWKFHSYFRQTEELGVLNIEKTDIEEVVFEKFKY